MLRGTEPPPNGIWVDSLDMKAVSTTVLRAPGRGGGRRGAEPATPPPPPIYALGGVTYPHAVPMQSDRDITIDLKGQSLRFASMVGIDSAVPAGRGSVIFGIWVDGRKVAMIGFQQTSREQYAGPGGWNDTDMLVVGMVGWSQGPRPTDLTPNEQLTHLALWSLQAAPLLIGADLSKIDEWTTNLLGNREMLAINQDPLGRPAGRKMSDGWVEVWARPLQDGTIAAGLFNRGPEAATVVAKWSDLGLTGRQPVRDVWLQKDLGRVDDQLSASVPRHGVLFVKIGTPKRPE